MSNIVSQPVVPAQPNLPSYGLSSLALFKVFTRDSFLATFGVQAPPFDPTKRPKSWFDTSLDATTPDDVTVYLHSPGQDTLGNPLPFKNMAITIGEARAVNLPGAYTYTAYVPAPTGANVVDLNGNTNPLNPAMLSLPADADEMAVEIGALFNKTFHKVEQTLGGPFKYNYPATEARRSFNIVSDDGASSYNVGALLILKYKDGINHPGKWTAVGSNPTWVSDVLPATTNTLPAWDTPIRALLANEKLTANVFSGVMISRTDMQNPATPTAGGGFTDADRAMLTDVQKKVAQLLKLATS